MSLAPSASPFARMPEAPWLSVLMPTYNGEAFLPAALDSLVAQGSPEIELIAVDDASTDSTTSILASFQDRLRLTIERIPHAGNWIQSTNRALNARAASSWLSCTRTISGCLAGSTSSGKCRRPRPWPLCSSRLPSSWILGATASDAGAARFPRARTSSTSSSS